MFQNLAGNPKATDVVLSELTRCGISSQHIDPVGEVPSAAMGVLGKFTFRRKWHYYRVEGPVPVSVAWELYDNPVGKQDIRVCCHCGCPAPTPEWVIYRTLDGKLVRPLAIREKLAEWMKPEELEEIVFDDDTSDYQGCIETYDIDSELGLYIFVETLKRHRLV